MFDFDVTIRGLQEAQAANNKAIAALRPSGAMGHAIKFVTMAAHRYAVAITHVDTGALRASHHMELRDTEGVISISGGARNPRSGRRTSEYGPYEHDRGGSHAFYARTAAELGPRLLEQAGRQVGRATGL